MLTKDQLTKELLYCLCLNFNLCIIFTFSVIITYIYVIITYIYIMCIHKPTTWCLFSVEAHNISNLSC